MDGKERLGLEGRRDHVDFLDATGSTETKAKREKRDRQDKQDCKALPVSTVIKAKRDRLGNRVPMDLTESTDKKGIKETLGLLDRRELRHRLKSDRRETKERRERRESEEATA